MPTFTIEAPDGRKLDIEADDENGAIAGAQDWISKNPLAPAAPPTVPLYASAGNGTEVNVNASPEIRSQYDAMVKQQDEAKALEQAQFDATRTPGARIADSATFMASMPVRAATRGEYGAGDVAGLVSEGAGQSLAQSEQDFARANQPGLEAAAAAGEVMAGVPFLNTMGGVPGQMLRTSVAATRQAPSIAKSILREERGAGGIGGGGIHGQSSGPNPATGPFVQPGASPTPPAAPSAGLPNRAETFAAADRLGNDLGAKVDLPEMVVGNRYKQSLAAGMKNIPFVGEPIEMAYDKGLRQMGGAKQAASGALGIAQGAEQTGQAVKQGALDWIRKNSKDYLEEKYQDVYANLKPEVTRGLSATTDVANRLIAEMKQSTGTAAAPAIKAIEEAISRPGGLNAKGLADLRSEIGRRIDAAKVVPDGGEAAYKRLYPALTADLRATIKQAGGDDALRAWDLANREARIIAGKRKRLAQVIGTNEDKLSAEAVMEKVASLATNRRSNLRNLRLMREVIGDKDWGNLGAELVNRIGMDPKTGLFSGDRYLSAYGQMSEHGKHLMFGPAKAHLDDIATIAKKFGELSARFNRSNTGTVNAVLKFLNNPTTVAVHAASALTNPVTAATFGFQASGLGAARAAAWSLAKPSHAQKAANVMKAYYGVASAARHGTEAVAKREQGLAAAVRSFAQTVAQETGQNADDVAAELMKQFTAGGSQSTP